MESTVTDYKNIKGWGVDADPLNDPTYSMKNRTDEEHKGYNWNRPTQQTSNIEILHSNERPNLSAVYGTSVPPSGLSGMIRRFAFKYSEATYAHWFALILADRINVVEGVVSDLKRGHVPNLFAEKGYKAEWKYNRAAFTKNILIGAAVSGVAIALLVRKKRKARLSL